MENTRAFKKSLFLCVLLFYSLNLVFGQSARGLSVANEEAESLFAQGTSEFQNGQFGRAIATFNNLLQNFSAYRGDANFWLAKSHIANNQIDMGEDFLERFISSFQDNRNYPEAIYQRGRIRFLRQNYDEAIFAFAQFIEAFPDTPFVANAIYWTAESLFRLDNLELAESMYVQVINEFPRSYRSEAAINRLEVLRYRKRERELISLVQLLQEGNNDLSEEFGQREDEYNQAISYYQNQIQNITSGSVRDELARLSNLVTQLEKERTNLNLQIRELEDTIRSQENEIRSLQNSGQANFVVPDREIPTRIIRSTDPDFQQRLEVLKLKEESFALKEQLISRFEAIIAEINAREN